MGAFGAGPIVREPGGLPLSDGEVETRVAAGLQWRGRPQGCKWRLLPAGLQTMGDADGDAVGSVEACRPCAGEALQGQRFVSGLPCVFGIKKKFRGIVYKRRLALTLPAALAFVSGLPTSRPVPVGRCRMRGLRPWRSRRPRARSPAS